MVKAAWEVLAVLNVGAATFMMQDLPANMEASKKEAQEHPFRLYRMMLGQAILRPLFQFRVLGRLPWQISIIPITY